MSHKDIIKSILSDDFSFKETNVYEIFKTLRPFLEDEDVDELMINGTRSVFIEINGKLKHLDIKISQDELVKFLDFVSRYSSRKIDFSNPIFDGKLSCGSRVSIVIEPVSQNGTIINIRKHKKLINNIGKLVAVDMLSIDMYKIFEDALLDKKNIIISGGTSSGKTTLMNALLNSLSETKYKYDRIVIIEDTKELNIDLEHAISLQARLAFQGIDSLKGEINMGDLVKASLRLRPDRLIIGEVRASEAYYLLHALNTGHKGSISSIHANSARDALRRLETLSILDHSNLNINIVRTWISSNIDMVVHLEKENGKRRVVEIFNMEGLEPNSYILRKVV